MVQTRQGVYSNGYTMEEATGENNQGRIFSPEHLVMFHIVDCDIYLNSEVDEFRFLRIYDQLKLRSSTDVPFVGSEVWRRTYKMNLTSVQRRADISRSFNIPLQHDNPSLLDWALLVELAKIPDDTRPQSISHPIGGWYGVVNGNSLGSSDWMLYSVEQNNRLLIPMPKELSNPEIPANEVPGFKP